MQCYSQGWLAGYDFFEHGLQPMHVGVVPFQTAFANLTDMHKRVLLHTVLRLPRRRSGPVLGYVPQAL